MKIMRGNARAVVLAFCAVLLWTACLSAADVAIRGTVADEDGKPVRAALVRVAVGKMTINRFSQNDGRFEVMVPPGTYTVTVDAFGFGLSRKTADTAQGGDLSFKLSPGADIMRMSGADMESLLPNTQDGENVKQCNQCHGFTMPMRHAGWVAKDWATFLPTMTGKRLGRFIGNPPPERLQEVAHSLEVIFGPDGMWGPNAQPPDMSKVKHTEMKDGALKATIKEWTIPTPTIAHSISVDAQTGSIWFGEYDVPSNKLTRFDPETEKFDEFPLTAPSLGPHTGSVIRGGNFVIALSSSKDHKLAEVDKNGLITLHDWPEKPTPARTAKMDLAGKNVWVTAGDETWAWDVETKKFTKAFKNPVPATFPEGSQAARMALPGQKPNGGGYDATGDSKGIGWVSQLENGTIIRIDPKTGQMKTYHTPEMRSTRGIAIDAQDNVWWGDYYGHKLGKLDTKTGVVKLYQPPTPNATPYGVTIDMRRGYVWYVDTIGNQAGRFDPKTETFLEFPVPTRIAALRFPGVDAQGHLWYSGYWNGKFGVIDPEGAIKILTTQRQ